MRENKCIVLPSEDKMKAAMSLGLPHFDIIDSQFSQGKKKFDQAKSMDKTRLNKDGGGLKDLYIQMQREAFFSLKKKRCEKSESYNFVKSAHSKENDRNDSDLKAREYMNANANWNLDDELSEKSDNSSIRSIYKDE